MTQNNNEPKFLVTPGLRIVTLFLTWIVGAIITIFVATLLGRALSDNYLASLRISTVIQDMMMWIIPAIATAVIVTRQPARLLRVDSLPSLGHTILGCLLLIVSAPLMSWIVKINSEIHLPESMASIEASLREMELNAETVVQTMLQSSNVASLILNILIIGIFAGLAEELFFRGALQRILSTGGLNIHVAIWVGAFIFSAIHFQFFGFVPRMLLGAAFGYMLYWSGSVWLPILIHSLNNIAYILMMTYTGSGEIETEAATSWVAIIISAVLTALVLTAFVKKPVCKS